MKEAKSNTPPEAIPHEDGDGQDIHKGVSPTERQAILEAGLENIAARIGVPAEVDRILEAIDTNINTALELETDLKDIASYLGVSDTVKHIKQRIDEMNADGMTLKRKIWLDGVNIGEAKATLHHEINRVNTERWKLTKRLSELDVYLKESETELERMQEKINRRFTKE